MARRAVRRKKIGFEEMEKIRENIVTVKCAFCNGTGKDPFGCLSVLSNCQVCGGKGTVRVEGPTMECRFCGGTGIQPYTTDRLPCSACGGKGVVKAIDPSMDCPACGGTGLYMGKYRQHCLKCKGQGIVPLKEEK